MAMPITIGVNEVNPCYYKNSTCKTSLFVLFTHDDRATGSSPFLLLFLLILPSYFPFCDICGHQLTCHPSRWRMDWSATGAVEALRIHFSVVGM